MTIKENFKAQQNIIATEAMAIMPYGYSVTTPFSESDYGMSAYVIVYNEKFEQVAKFRVSDHSVMNLDRMRNEVHFIGEANLETFDPFFAVELALYPNRYREVKNVYSSETVEAAVPVGEKSNCIPQNAVVVGQKVAKKSGKVCDIYQWTKERFTVTHERI